MTARSRTLVLAVGLLAAAGAAVLWARLGVAGRDEAERARRDAGARLYTFAPAQVKALLVEAKGDRTRLVRSGEGWSIEAPRPGPADRIVTDALVERVATLRRTADVAEAAAGARFGLERPRIRVELTLQDGRIETLAVGDENPFDGSLYVRTGAGTVAIVPGDLRWAVERGSSDLAARAPPRPDSGPPSGGPPPVRATGGPVSPSPK